LIYIAGPYTRPDPVENTHRIIAIADALLEEQVTPLVPHLTLLWHLVSPKPYAEWIEYDEQLLLRCDAVLRIPGESTGAIREVHCARQAGIPVIWSRSACPEQCAKAVRHWLNQRDNVLAECADCGRHPTTCRCQAGEG
jgi:hypothetical protein